MNTNLKKSSLLVLGSIFIANIANAVGVAEISNNATDAEITSAKALLETPTLESDSSYKLEETQEDGVFTISKYLKNTETKELTEVKYDVDLNLESYSYTNISYDWDVVDSHKILDLDIGFTYNTTGTSEDRVAHNPNYNKITYIGGNFIELVAVTYGYGGAMYNSGEIETVSGSFIANYARNSGGAIYNEGIGVIDVITASFMGNYARAGGAIFNYDSTSEIGEISSNGGFLGNYVTGIFAQGGAIFNTLGAEIDDIRGDFIGNYVFSTESIVFIMILPQ